MRHKINHYKFKMDKKLIYFILTAWLFTSCIPSKNLQYAHNIKEGQEEKNDYVNILAPRTIKATDELYIKVLSTDEVSARILSRETGERDNYNLNLLSYRVDEAGTIDFPFIGKLYLKDLTIDQAKDKIIKELEGYLKNASVIIKFVNNKVTVIGEVSKPGEYLFYNEQTNIFRAIGMAGGITNYGNKSKVILIRESDNSLTYHYLDLTSKDIVGSDYYYIHPNDVILVNPIKAKFWTMTSFNWGTALSAITTGLSLLYYFDNKQ